MWVDSLQVEVKFISHNHVSGEVMDEEESQSWTFFGVYGFLEEHNKRKHGNWFKLHTGKAMVSGCVLGTSTISSMTMKIMVAMQDWKANSIEEDK